MSEPEIVPDRGGELDSDDEGEGDGLRESDGSSVGDEVSLTLSDSVGKSLVDSDIERAAVKELVGLDRVLTDDSERDDSGDGEKEALGLLLREGDSVFVKVGSGVSDTLLVALREGDSVPLVLDDAAFDELPERVLVTEIVEVLVRDLDCV